MIDQSPRSVTWKFVRGDTIEYPFRLVTRYPDGSRSPVDLTGWTIEGEIREHEDDEDPIGTITGYIDPVQENETKGVYALALSDTSEFPDNCVGDVEFKTPTGDVHTYQRFKFKVTRDVTRIETP